MKRKSLMLVMVLGLLMLLTIRPSARAESPNTIDFSGTWKDPFDITCWLYKFIVVENDIVIRAFCKGGAEEIFGWATLSGRHFTGKMNTAPGPSGGSRYAGKIEGRISDDNKIIYMTWPHRDGPYNGRLIRE